MATRRLFEPVTMSRFVRNLRYPVKQRRGGKAHTKITADGIKWMRPHVTEKVSVITSRESFRFPVRSPSPVAVAKGFIDLSQIALVRQTVGDGAAHCIGQLRGIGGIDVIDDAVEQRLRHPVGNREARRRPESREVLTPFMRWHPMIVNHHLWSPSFPCLPADPSLAEPCFELEFMKAIFQPDRVITGRVMLP